MGVQEVQACLDSAHQRCSESGLRLTQKREQILRLMLEAEAPLSPYEVVDLYNAQAEQNMPPNSAYRILDFLAEANLVHKLNSANKYIACSHIACSHPHSASQFLICSQCKTVKEVMMEPKLLKEIQKNVSSAGFKMRHPSVELECLCGDCSES